ncbi:VOC family protein [Halioglobus maricola]|uniref:VOC family protein n=1 Tax=Halioglobus maricola TaxID=2601894 RepID=A0A5P9NJN4_9GAMM|nr:VOC family protein [Halioglobus maricola]QFU75716.1 VOC family protein [Halioglobus maricola]
MIADFDNIPTLPPIMGPAKQIAYLVDDIDEGMDYWHREHSVGPFMVARNASPLSNAFYRGEKAPRTSVNIAFGYVGDMQIELIEQIGDTPGLYQEAIDRKHTGVHHYAVCVEDFPTAYNWALDNGYDAVIDAGMDGLARMSYVENPDTGLILEVIEWNALTRPYFDGLEKLVRSSDSKQISHDFKLADLTPKSAVLGKLVTYSLNKMLGRVEQTRRPTNTGNAA